MQKQFLRKIFFILLLLGFMNINILKSNALDHKNILFISSYSPNFTSFNDQLNALFDTLNPNYDLQVEYMDAKRFKGEESEETFFNLLKFKVKNYKKFDAVILGDDAALSFGLKYKSSLFNDIPIVFFGVTEEDNIQKAIDLNIAGGVTEYASIYENIKLINTIYPNQNKNLILLAGNPVKYNREITEFYNLKNKFPNFNFDYLEIPAESNTEFENKLSNLNSSTDIVFYIYPYRDGIGKSISVESSIDIISEHINVPIFTTLQYDIGNNSNMIGGKVINHAEQGRLAADLVNKILQGEQIHNRFVSCDSSNVWSFNYNMLNHYNIDESILPSNSNVLNKPIPFWIQYRDFIIPVLLIIVILVLIIVVFIFNTIKSIKHRKELQSAKKLAEDANLAKDSFISTISHELRTPVAIILSSSQLLKRKIEKENLYSTSSINSTFDIINQNSNRLLRLINNIIDIVKVDSGFGDLNLKNIDIVNLIEDTVLSVIPYAKSKNLNIVFDTNIEEFIMSVDVEKIERIVLNLLSNAIKFSHHDNDILTKINVDGKFLTFRVQDFGVGIDSNNLNSIFDKFTQIDNSFTRHNEGSGIGLSIVKSFIELHDGKITVESSIDSGSIFTFYLPIKNIDLDDNIITEIPSNLDKVDIELSDIFK